MRAVPRAAGSLLVGGTVGALVALLWQGSFAFAAGWTATALTYTAWVWLSTRKLDARETRENSQAADAGMVATDLIATLGAIGSLVGVGVLLAAESSKGTDSYLKAGFGVASVLASWVLVHMIYLLRYAREYYGPGNRGIDFNSDDDPDYRDFAYLSFCLGMTYQVSDTDIKSRLIRHTVLHHTLLSYGLGAVAIASTINLVSQLASGGGG